jgi:hypothetical protein
MRAMASSWFTVSTFFWVSTLLLVPRRLKGRSVRLLLALKLPESRSTVAQSQPRLMPQPS